MARARGAQSENFFQAVCKAQGISCVRIPDGCKMIKGTAIRVRTPFDYIVGHQDKVAFIDVKTIMEERFSYSKITQHQVQSLSVLGRHARSGYVVFFRTSGEFVFFTWVQLASLQRGESLKPADGVSLGNKVKQDFARIFLP